MAGERLDDRVLVGGVEHPLRSGSGWFFGAK
jgi:hypothetical protein